MRRRPCGARRWGLCVGLILLAGCQSAPLRFLSLIGIKKEPLVVALVAAQPAGKAAGPLAPLNPFGPYEKLQAVLSAGLGRPIGWDLCFPIQLAPALASGLCHAAVVTPADYARLPDRQRFRAVVVPADAGGQVARPALLIVPAGSPIESVEQVRGKIVAFGPRGDSRTHHAALLLLADHALKPGDLSLELLPLPGSLKHLPDGRSVAQSVMNASSDAGFIGEDAWEALPEAAGRADEPARERFRVVGRTIALPDRLVLGSPKLDEATIKNLREVFVAAGREHPEALVPLHASRYEVPSAGLLEACERLAEAAAAVDRPIP